MSTPSLFSNHRVNLLVIANVTVLTYLIVMVGGFCSLDDVSLMRDLQQGHVLPGELFLAGGGRYYRPLLMLTYYGNYLLSGTNPAAFHATSLALHVLNASLLYGVGCLLLKVYSYGRCGALVAALLFAVTPLNTESVAWISARTDLLCGLFFLAALMVLLADNISTAVAPVLFGFFFLFSLLAKESSAPLLVIAPLYLLMNDNGRSRRRLRLFSIASLVSFFLYIVLRTGAFAKRDGGVARLAEQVAGSSAGRIVSDSLGAIGFYLKKLIWPFPLNLAVDSINLSLYLPVAILLLLVAAIMLLRLRETRLQLLIIVGCLGPPLLALHGSIPWTLYAERYLYLSMTGMVLLVGLLAARFWSRPAVVLSFGVVLACALAANGRAALWADQMALWRDTVEKSPQVSQVRTAYAFELINIGRFAEAEAFLDKEPERQAAREFFWKCRAMVYHQRRDYANYKQAMLKAAGLSANPAELLADMARNLPQKYRQ